MSWSAPRVRRWWWSLAAFQRTGTLKFLGAAMREASRDLVVEATVENTDGTLRPGFFCNARIRLSEEKAAVVPVEALRVEGSRRKLFVIEKNNTLSERLVEVGETREGFIEIRRGAAAGESVLLAGAYRFARATVAREAELTRIIRQLLRELKRQVLANVSATVSVDYDDTVIDGLNVIAMAKVPSLVLSGPTLRPNRFYSANVPHEDVVAGSSGPELVRRKPPYTVDLVFTLTAASERTAELFNSLNVCAGLVHTAPDVAEATIDRLSSFLRYTLGTSLWWACGPARCTPWRVTAT